ncbi:MAG: hypothetical protein ACOC2M_02605 [bacterium]
MGNEIVTTTCKLCQTQKKLAKAHIIPKSIITLLKADENPLQIMYSNPRAFSKKSQIGPYDKNILCVKCDNFLGSYDDYGQKFFSKTIDDYPIKVLGPNARFIEAKNFSYNKVKMFLLSILWRASVANLDVFSAVNLGPYEDIIRISLLKREVLNDNRFSIIIFRYNYDPLKVPTLMPFKDVMAGVNYYRLYLLNFLIFIKVDQRSFPEEFYPLILKKNKTLPIILLNYETSKELEIMRMIIGLDNNATRFRNL